MSVPAHVRGRVTIDERGRGVNIALGHLPLGVRPKLDSDGTGGVPIDPATAEDRVLVGLHLGLADIRRYPQGTHPGIVVFRLKGQRWKTLQESARRLLSTSALKELRRGLAIAR